MTNFDINLTSEQLLKFRCEASDPASLHLLSSFLASHPGPWPARDLILTFQEIYKSAPQSLKTENHESLTRLQAQVKAVIPRIEDLVGTDSRAGLIDVLTGRHLTHCAIREFVQSFHIPVNLMCHGRKPRIVVILPNGPLMAIAVLAFANRYTIVPMSSNTVPEQLRLDIEQVEADAVVALENDIEKLQLDPCHRPVLGLKSLDDLTFQFVSMPSNSGADHPPNSGDDIAIILFTSGTSGNKKLVPITTYNLIAGTMATIESVELSEADTCLNMMPLNHVGGIIRSIFSPLLAGGATICCPSFDPSMFWDAVQSPTMTPTWYYATPTMHQMILAEAEQRPDAVRQSAIQFICNAGAGLPPTLAMQLRDTFHCAILPSYGMTECMPIAAPPKHYALDRHGTSGRIVGPEVAILTDQGTPVARCEMLGHICVRGSPAFEGYLTPDGQLDTSAFDADGWFDTGDLGYLDVDNYLYITGRSKEVINRGGEIISPVEVEDAVLASARHPESPLYGRVMETLAFSVPDEILQEVVGAVIVTPPGVARPDLRQLHEALQPLIHQPKWPALVVYMDRVPKANNKIQRIKFAQRLGIDPLTPATVLAERHYEAICPPMGTALSASIAQTACVIDHPRIQSAVADFVNAKLSSVHVQQNTRDGFADVILFDQNVADAQQPTAAVNLQERLDGYLIPSRIISLPGPMPMDLFGNPDQDAIDSAVRARNAPGDLSSIQGRVREIFAVALSMASEDVSVDTDFFVAGGDSLTAGRLVSQLRREFGVFLAGDILFHQSTVGEIETTITEAVAIKASQSEDEDQDLPGCERTYSSTHPLLLVLHLLPVTFFFPMKRAFQWLLFSYVVAECSTRFPIREILIGRLILIVLAVLSARVGGHIVFPFCGIAFKWLVIGRYKEGLFPMWGPYHTRWWLTQKALQVCGKGMFNHFNWSRVLFYRLLGARIGANVTLSPSAKLGEYDLIEIEDDVVLDIGVQCRPFGVERNTSMLLKRIHIGRGASVGIKSIVAPGADVPEKTCIGPNSSSWELSDADSANRDLLTSRIPQPHWLWSLLIVEPIRILVWVAARLTWMGGLVPMVRQFPVPQHDMFLATLEWYTSGRRIGLHITARICRAIGGPIVLFLSIWIAKFLLDLICGRPQPGPASKQNTRQKVRSAVLAQILPAGDLHELTRLVGRHYELVSMAIRALGGKVGKRVYWPSVGPAVPDFDLLEVGNDVVFGSRSSIVTADGYGRDRVVIGDGTMVGDRVVALPGVTIGREAMIGSGALLRRNGDYPAHTVWTGSKRGDAVQFPTTTSGPISAAPTVVGSSGSSTNVDSDDEKPSGTRAMHIKPGALDQKPEAVSETKKDTCKPFGRAFYRHEANYYVLRIWQIVIYSVISVVFTTVYWLLTVVFALLALRAALTNSEAASFQPGPWRPFVLYGLLASILSGISCVQTFIALGVVIGVKWMVMGRRTEGAFHWDKSSYNQRWQFLLSCETIIKDCYGGTGVLPMITGSAYLAWYYRFLGAKIGKDCAIHANGTPNIFFTEPDLLSLGDRVAVDDASLVCHLNSRGEFELHTLKVGNRSIMRAGSRLMSGASMGQDACILEHTLVLSGDHVEDGVTLQGWPAEGFQNRRV
ncbi:NRPS-like protein biosynthetic cluster [Penicillium macrosclerotiorum]|uniref:NRPS-like protein biosynthetic cluster n=1 Tax=Penicillium macrosclerotiorum TaxID=303699 RepID=UPI002548385F|nr:NRPS-like protein biosynthetic cluster [Penicillium macrosclerotiorum]KAJ5683632.1 NRPS-like protein biosynthetic cluster [Penicillium macrosclerotiorum]